MEVDNAEDDENEVQMDELLDDLVVHENIEEMLSNNASAQEQQSEEAKNSFAANYQNVQYSF